MAHIIINDLNADLNLDKAALSKILGGSATAIAGNSVAIAGAGGVFAGFLPKMPWMYGPSFGPKAFQLSYNTSFEQSYYQRFDQSLNINYLQG